MPNETILHFCFDNNLHQKCNKLKMVAGTSPYVDSIWDEFSEQHQHQSTKKAPYSMPYFELLWL